MSLRFDDDTRERLRQKLLQKGQDIADKLADVLAGKDKNIPMSELPVFARKPGMRPEERLRGFLDHIESCRELLDNDDDRYGRCKSCDKDLGLAALDDMPWADRCQECAPPP